MDEAMGNVEENAIDENQVDQEPEANGGDSAPVDETREFTSDDQFRFVGQEFRESIEALRETHDELSPAASELDSLRNIWDGSLVERLTDEDRSILIAVFRNVPEGGVSTRELVDRLLDAVEDKEWGPEVATHFIQRIYRPRRQPIFHNAMLISSVAAFEAHVAKLAKQYYRSSPAALHKVPRESAKEFSLKDLQALGSLDEAIELAIERRVTELMYGNLADWRRFFQDAMKIDITDLGGEWTQIQEVFERRHCIVHSEAKASRRYIQTYTATGLHWPLDADADYVRNATEALELLGSLMHLAVWAKFAEDDQEVVDYAEVIAFDSLKESRWDFSKQLYKYWQTLPLSEAEQRMAKVNLWICAKEVSGLDSIENEVSNWDVSGSDEIYSFAKHCLLEELDEAFAMLPTMIERKKIVGRGLATWPLLAPLREDPRIQSYAGMMRGYLAEVADNPGDHQMSLEDGHEFNASNDLDTESEKTSAQPGQD